MQGKRELIKQKRVSTDMGKSGNIKKFKIKKTSGSELVMNEYSFFFEGVNCAFKECHN